MDSSCVSIINEFDKMGNASSTGSGCPFAKKKDADPKDIPLTPDGKPRPKICCACPQTRETRDECLLRKSRDECAKEIEAHFQCLLREGFTNDEVERLRQAGSRPAH